MRQRTRRILTLALMLTLVTLIVTSGSVLARQPLASNAGDGVVQVTILHNNDGESELLPDGDFGGVARFATVVRGCAPRSAVRTPCF